ncbi:MAG: DUF2027 domain-containing protein [Chlorobi bacterium]|nr:DUF2027 domain-containing protein [Chlorobiota bacterium]
MKFNIGDRVVFLNESGGGVVSKILSPSLVNVRIEDGFEIPVVISELMKVETGSLPGSFKSAFDEEVIVEAPEQPKQEYESDSRNIPLMNIGGQGILEKGIFLAYVPHDQKWLITGMVDLYLVNHTEYDILYSFIREEEKGGFSGFDYGSVTPESMLLIESIERDEIEKWCRGVVQVLYQKEEDTKILSPGSAEFRVKPARFYTEGSYKNSSLMEGKAIVVSLLPLSAQASLLRSGTEKKQTEPEVKIAKEVKPKHIIEEHKTSPHEAVVDLHIYELVDNHQNMENSEMLRVQINYFTKCLDSAIANNLSKVTFIHGVGTGVLKTAIKEILKDYNNVSSRDASMKEFGYGATEVLIRK